jgi:hypothetical protein
VCSSDLDAMTWTIVLGTEGLSKSTVLRAIRFKRLESADAGFGFALDRPSNFEAKDDALKPVACWCRGEHR